MIWNINYNRKYLQILCTGNDWSCTHLLHLHTHLFTPVHTCPRLNPPALTSGFSTGLLNKTLDNPKCQLTFGKDVKDVVVVVLTLWSPGC